jgi:hypothetical protein
LAAHADAAIYYYSKYERTIYRRLKEKYPCATRVVFEALPNNYGVQPKLPSLIAGTLS